MKLRDYIKYLNKEADYTIFNGLTIKVKTLDIKTGYQNVFIQITPVNGSGNTWVAFRNLTFN